MKSLLVIAALLFPALVQGQRPLAPLPVNVRGSVSVDGGGLRPRLAVAFSPVGSAGKPISGPVLESGSFSLFLQAGEYCLVLSRLPEGYRVESVKMGSEDLLTGAFTVATGETPSPINIILTVQSPPWERVSGHVTGLPAPQAGGRFKLSLTGGPTGELLIAEIQDDGAFAFPRVLPGSYAATIAPRLPIASTAVVVPAKRDLENVEIALPPLREVSGRVNVEGKAPASRSITFEWTEETTGAGRQNVVASVTAKADGSFKVMLPEGERRVNLVPSIDATVRSLMYGSTDLSQNPLILTNTSTAEFQIALVARPGGPLALPGGVVSGEAGIGAPPPPPPPPPPPSPRQSAPSTNNDLIRRVAPVYPQTARTAGIQGAVILQATITKEGAIGDLKVLSGPPLLREAAIDAVKQWRYKPRLSNGQPVEVLTVITVNFTLAAESPQESSGPK